MFSWENQCPFQGLPAWERRCLGPLNLPTTAAPQPNPKAPSREQTPNTFSAPAEGVPAHSEGLEHDDHPSSPFQLKPSWLREGWLVPSNSTLMEQSCAQPFGMPGWRLGWVRVSRDRMEGSQPPSPARFLQRLFPAAQPWLSSYCNKTAPS